MPNILGNQENPAFVRRKRAPTMTAGTRAVA
jgi:hypothetical protein